MCSISGSYSIEKIKELTKLNAYRGELSHSITVFDQTAKVVYQSKGLGPLVLENHKLPIGYILVHQQAPTTEYSPANIHPAIIDGNMLWHNGIIKHDSIHVNNIKFGTNYTWDTELLLKALIQQGAAALNNFDGSFACVLKLHDKLYCFRNEISPLFTDGSHFVNISSTQTVGMRELEPNRLYNINLITGNLQPSSQFKTYDNPYYFPN